MIEDLEPFQEWHCVTHEIFEREVRPLGKLAVLRGLVPDWNEVQPATSLVAGWLAFMDLPEEER